MCSINSAYAADNCRERRNEKRPSADNVEARDKDREKKKTLRPNGELDAGPVGSMDRFSVRAIRRCSVVIVTLHNLKYYFLYCTG